MFFRSFFFRKLPGVLLCPEIWNINLSIISIFNSIKWGAADKTKWLSMRRWGGLFSVVTDSWGGCCKQAEWKCSPSLQFFFPLQFFKASLSLKEEWWRVLWRVLEVRYSLWIKKKKWHGPFRSEGQLESCKLQRLPADFYEQNRDEVALGSLDI